MLHYTQSCRAYNPFPVTQVKLKLPPPFTFPLFPTSPPFPSPQSGYLIKGKQLLGMDGWVGFTTGRGIHIFGVRTRLVMAGPYRVKWANNYWYDEDASR